MSCSDSRSAEWPGNNRDINFSEKLLAINYIITPNTRIHKLGPHRTELMKCGVRSSRTRAPQLSNNMYNDRIAFFGLKLADFPQKRR